MDTVPTASSTKQDDRNPYAISGYGDSLKAERRQQRDDLCNRRKKDISDLIRQYRALTKNPGGLANAQQRLENLLPGFYKDCLRTQYPNFATAVAAWRIDGSRRVSVEQAFWTTAPFQIMGAAQVVEKSIMAADHNVSATLARVDAKLLAGAVVLFSLGVSALRFVASRGASAF